MGDRGRKLVQLACMKSDISDDRIMKVELPLENRNPTANGTSSNLEKNNANLKNLDAASKLRDTHDTAVPLMSPNDVEIISNSSSDLNVTQMDTVLKMKDLLEDNLINIGQSPEVIASTSQIIYCYASDASSEKENLFGSDFTDKDPTYVPDSDELNEIEYYQNDSGSAFRSFNVIGCQNDTVKLILENILDRVWLSVKPLTRRKRARPTEWKRNISKTRKAEGLSYITKGVLDLPKCQSPFNVINAYLNVLKSFLLTNETFCVVIIII
ncbi:hypothetical protein ACJJTC_004678 [Scirpophaga incertulas]